MNMDIFLNWLDKYLIIFINVSAQVFKINDFICFSIFFREFQLLTYDVYS